MESSRIDLQLKAIVTLTIFSSQSQNNLEKQKNLSTTLLLRIPFLVKQQFREKIIVFSKNWQEGSERTHLL
jgi:hypothetical protein